MSFQRRLESRFSTPCRTAPSFSCLGQSLDSVPDDPVILSSIRFWTPACAGVTRPADAPPMPASRQAIFAHLLSSRVLSHDPMDHASHHAGLLRTSSRINRHVLPASLARHPGSSSMSFQRRLESSIGLGFRTPHAVRPYLSTMNQGFNKSCLLYFSATPLSYACMRAPAHCATAWPAAVSHSMVGPSRG
jgi:hypothetical protein